jgi:hypothetical protein
VDHSNNTQHSSEGRSVKAIRCARERNGVGRLVFGEDIAMDKFLDLSERAVVGRFRGKKLGMAYLKRWVHNYWLPEISKMPHIRLLTRGWLTFVLSSTADVDWVLKKVWSIAATLTLLKCWTPTFDAKREWVDEEPIWVRLSGLPMQY